MYRRLATIIAVFLLTLTTLGAGESALAKPAGNGSGNSANAKACQKGGWQSLARSEDPRFAFGKQGDCVSYGAQGGVIVPHVPEVNITWTNNPYGVESCAGWIVFNRIEPGQYLLSTSWEGNADENVHAYPITINSSGEVEGFLHGYSEWGSVTVEIGGISVTSSPHCDY